MHTNEHESEQNRRVTEGNDNEGLRGLGVRLRRASEAVFRNLKVVFRLTCILDKGSKSLTAWQLRLTGQFQRGRMWSVKLDGRFCSESLLV